MKYILIILSLLLTQLNATIDIDKSAITIVMSKTLKQSKDIANQLPDNDIYIYKTTTTKKPYYILYAVNIEKNNIKIILNKIKELYRDAYITSKNRIKKLKSNNFKTIKKMVKDVDIDKKSLFIKYTKNKQELYDFIRSHRQYDIFIQNIKNKSLIHYDRCCAIYIVNLSNKEYIILKHKVDNYPNMKDSLSIKLKYINSQHNLSKLIAHKDINKSNNK